MWLGLSALSVAEMLEKVAKMLWKKVQKISPTVNQDKNAEIDKRDSLFQKQNRQLERNNSGGQSSEAG